MSQQYEKAKEILMRKAKELGVEADKLSTQAMDSLNRARFIDALLLQNKDESEIDKLCAAKDYGAIPEHYKSIIDDEKNDRLDKRVQKRLLSLKELQNKGSLPSSLGVREMNQHVKASPSGEIPTREDIEKILRQLGGKPYENVFKEKVEAYFAREERKLSPDWWNTTKEDLVKWSKEK